MSIVLSLWLSWLQSGITPNGGRITSQCLKSFGISPIHTAVWCRDRAAILRLCVNVSEAARGEISLRHWYASEGSIRGACPPACPPACPTNSLSHFCSKYMNKTKKLTYQMHVLGKKKNTAMVSPLDRDFSELSPRTASLPSDRVRQRPVYWWPLCNYIN